MAPSQKRKILLTGCAGFIGSHLAERLLALGNQVTGIDNFDPFYSKELKTANLEVLLGHADFQFFEFNLADKSAYSQLNGSYDVVVHLAAKAGVLPSLKDANAYIEANITATNHLLEWMKDNGLRKLVFASSSSVYGNNKKIPFSENDAVSEPISPYAFTKRACELMNFSYHHLYHIDILNLRLFTVYGPRQRPDLAIHKFVKLIDEGQPLNMYGDGSTARDYTYVADTVDGFVKAIDYIMSNDKVYEIINLGNNNPVKLKELVDAIYGVMGKQPQINVMPMQPGDVDITYADITKAKAMLGYSPATPLHQGLKQFIEWYGAKKA
ncbi:MAG: GDP-mannose 4,6-dehydratase [Chitinophagales bacterium]|nr:GDP-mannose 4,6-dehydratase [Chitinophagales bacterium]